jgi:hypothetical protein
VQRNAAGGALRYGARRPPERGAAKGLQRPTSVLPFLSKNREYNLFMKNLSVTAVLSRALEPISGCLTPKAAAKLLKLKLDKKTQARLDVLADKCTEGDLSAEERAEHESAVLTLELVTLLQPEARAFLATHKAS